MWEERGGSDGVREGEGGRVEGGREGEGGRGEGRREKSVADTPPSMTATVDMFSVL